MKMNKTRNKIILFLVSIITIHSASATLNWMQADNFWFAGYMYIIGDAQLSYRLVSWNTSSNSWQLQDPVFRTNTVINVRDLFGGLHNCPYMYWGGSPMNSTNIALVPTISQGSVFDKSKAQQFQNDLKAGKYAPYIVMSRRQTSIDIYIIGPVFNASTNSDNVTQFVSRKLTFNFLPFENIYVKQSIWYKNLDTHWPEGIAFAPSFTVDMTNKNAYFMNSPDDNQIQFDLNKPRQNVTLNDSALYLYGLEKQGDALGWSWTYQGKENFNLKGMTLKALQDQGIVVYQSAVPLDELQNIINFLNATGYAKFDSILQ